MKVNLQIEEDPQFRDYVKELIGGQVRAILRDQLAGIVAGEIAKLRLLQPNSPALSDMVSKQVNSGVQSQMRFVLQKANEEVSLEVRKAIAPVLANLQTQIKVTLADAIRNAK